MKEVSDLWRSAKGYPNKDDLSGDDKLLHFYTGLNSFTILMAVFNLVSPTINEARSRKLAQDMPFCFRPNYGLKVTSIIDCFELFIGGSLVL